MFCFLIDPDGWVEVEGEQFAPGFFIRNSDVVRPSLGTHHLSIKSESLSRMIFFGEKSFRRAVDFLLLHYHAESNHEGLSNKLIGPSDTKGRLSVAGDSAGC